MDSEKPTQKELKNGFRECKMCSGILMLEAGFEVATSACMRCGEHVASRDEFFNVPVELMSK